MWWENLSLEFKHTCKQISAQNILYIIIASLLSPPLGVLCNYIFISDYPSSSSSFTSALISGGYNFFKGRFKRTIRLDLSSVYTSEAGTIPSLPCNKRSAFPILHTLETLEADTEAEKRQPTSKSLLRGTQGQVNSVGP